MIKKLLVFSTIYCIMISAYAVDLKVVATGLNSSNGVVQFSLYNKDGTIPDKKLNKYYKMQRASIENKQVKIIFKNLPKGRYAINVFHDENNNYKIDQGFLMPKEGVGFSNFKSINLLNVPDFKKASFILENNQKFIIKVIYF